MLANQRFFIVCLMSAVVCSANDSPAAEPKEWTSENLDQLVTLYKHFHAHPELSYREQKTALKVAQEFQKAGFEVTEKIGGFGVVGILNNGTGPTVMFRGDMDALPVIEQTGLDYASMVKTKD